MKPSKEKLTEMYEANQMSVTQIASLLNIGKTTVLKYMNYYDIPRRSISESLTGKLKSLEHRKKLSESKKGKNNPNFGKRCPVHGKRCWYKCPNGKTVSMRSQWEVWYAEWLRINDIKFEYEPETFVFSDGTAYTPDFFLIDTNEYVEVKGWLTEKHKQKLLQFQKDYPNKVIILADKNYLANLGIDLKKKWITSKPLFACDKCGANYYRVYPRQKFCSVPCRNSYNRSKKPINKTLQLTTDKPRQYRGNQSGEFNNGVKTTVEKVKKARELSNKGWNNTQIANYLEMSPGNVSNIVNGKSWKGIT